MNGQLRQADRVGCGVGEYVSREKGWKFKATKMGGNGLTVPSCATNMDIGRMMDTARKVQRCRVSFSIGMALKVSQPASRWAQNSLNYLFWDIIRFFLFSTFPKVTWPPDTHPGGRKR